ncbi:unnamed protein product, partial [marine sediment metagenome]
MKFELGQKVKYKRITRKIEINMQYWDVPDFEQDEEKELARREFIELNKERTGYIMGRRKLVFKTIFSVNNDHYDDDGNVVEFVDIERQEYGFVYLVAYGMRHTNHVLEED